MTRKQALAEIWPLLALVLTMALMAILFLAAGYPFIKLFPICAAGSIIGGFSSVALYVEARNRK